MADGLEVLADNIEANQRHSPISKFLDQLGFATYYDQGELPRPEAVSPPFDCPHCHLGANSDPSTHAVGCPLRTHDLEKAKDLAWRIIAEQAEHKKGVLIYHGKRWKVENGNWYDLGVEGAVEVTRQGL